MDPSRKLLQRYVLAATIVWVALIAGTAALLRGTPYLEKMLILLGGGAVWFVILTPNLLFGVERVGGP